jgi:hypothetical protein
MLMAGRMARPGYRPPSSGSNAKHAAIATKLQLNIPVKYCPLTLTNCNVDGGSNGERRLREGSRRERGGLVYRKRAHNADAHGGRQGQSMGRRSGDRTGRALSQCTMKRTGRRRGQSGAKACSQVTTDGPKERVNYNRIKKRLRIILKCND